MKLILIVLLLSVSVLKASPIKTRALHLVIRGGEDIVKMEELVLYAKKYHFNTLILMLANGVSLDSMPWLKDKKKIWSKKDFISFVHFAQKNGFDIIPEIKLLTHQEKLLAGYFPQLMLNKSTYNPNNPKVYKIIFPIIDEIIELTKCNIFHIGHDEVAGYARAVKKKHILPGEKRLSKEDYYKDIMKIYYFLKNKHVKTMMWGDMLISPQEFPNMKQIHLHGVEGFNELRRKLPKDIIIGDWHYFGKETNFPSYKMFHDEGFTVFGATWRRYRITSNFSKYVKDLNLSNSGMIATTWYIPTGKKNYFIKKLIQISGGFFIDDK